MRRAVGVIVAGCLAVMLMAGPAGAKADVNSTASVPSGSTMSSADAAAMTKAQALCTKGVKRAHVLVSAGAVAAEFSYSCSAVASKAAGGYTPVPTDFAISVSTLSKQCFGSAGCNLTFRIAVQYVGTRLPDPSKTYTVTYDIGGAESPQTNHFTVKGTQITGQSQESAQTNSDGDVLTATATNVLEG